MLESVRDDLVAHQGSPTKDPARAPGDDPRRRRAADPVHQRDPRRASARPRTTASPRSRRSPRSTPSTATCRRSSSRTSSRTAATTARSPAEIATDAAEQYWRTGLSDAPHRDLPAWAGPISIDDMERLIGHAQRLLPDVGIQVPPNLADWWPRLVAAGATDLGGPERQRRPHLARAPVPDPRARAQAPGPRRRRAERAPVRLRALHRPASGSTSRCSTWSRRSTGASSRAAAPGAARRRSRSAPTASPPRWPAPARASRWRPRS